MLKLNDRILNYCIYFVFAILILYPLVEFIDALPLILWDESRQAANAIEMYTNDHWIVTYYDGEPDMWNTKPPLLIWLQVLSMHILGCTVMALRMPSVIAAFFTTLALFFFVKKEVGNIWIAFFSGIALISMKGFNGLHVARTADYDSLLILFIMLSLFQFYYYLDTYNKKHLILVFLFLSFGTLTKGVAALFFLPGMFLYALTQQKVIRILKDPFFYVGALMYLIIVASFYLSREYQNPGYINDVYINELGGRFLVIKEGHNGNFLSYLYLLSSIQTYFWFNLFLALLILCPLFIDQFKFKKIFIYFLILTLCFIVLLTTSKTKLSWYPAPAIPMIACMSILLLFNLFIYLIQKFQVVLPYEKQCILITISIICFFGYLNIAMLNNHPQYKHDWKDLSYFLDKPTYPIQKLNLKIINHTPFNQLYHFYIKRLQLTNPAIDFGNYKELKSGDDVLVADTTINTYIKLMYATEELYHKDNVYIYAIK